MNFIEAIIIAIVEGLTEFLPVSSTGHMIITESLLGVDVDDRFVNAFTVIIQFGAILSVVCLYWRKFFYPETMRTKGYTWWQAIWRFYLKLIVGVIPAVILGLAFNDFIESNLGNVMLVAIMLILGGVFMLFCDRIFNKGSESTELTYERAFVIGVVQCISMIPGVSRSMATIVGGMSQRLSRKNAAEFSFFLAVPTMFAATCYKLLKLYMDFGSSVIMDNLTVLIVGNVVAFVVAVLAVKFFIDYVTKYGFKLFGYYRIIVGVVILVMLMSGANLTID